MKTGFGCYDTRNRACKISTIQYWQAAYASIRSVLCSANSGLVSVVQQPGAVVGLDLLLLLDPAGR